MINSNCTLFTSVGVHFANPIKNVLRLNVFGVASKIQFEENWIIFLSVINLYVDESFQLQVEPYFITTEFMTQY